MKAGGGEEDGKDNAEVAIRLFFRFEVSSCMQFMQFS
jgi:hypothetical protein